MLNKKSNNSRQNCGQNFASSFARSLTSETLCSMLRKKCVFGTLSCIYRVATTLVSYARSFPHNEHIHTKIYIASRREQGEVKEERV